MIAIKENCKPSLPGEFLWMLAHMWWLGSSQGLADIVTSEREERVWEYSITCTKYGNDAVKGRCKARQVAATEATGL